MEITNPITAIINKVAKAVNIPLLSSESSLLFASAENNIAGHVATCMQCRGAWWQLLKWEWVLKVYKGIQTS